MDRSKTTMKSFSLLTGITVIEKIITFLFKAIIAATLGAGIVTDGYFTSSELFYLIDAAFLSAMVVVALNRFTLRVNTENEEEGFKALSDLQGFYFPLMVALAVLIFVCAKPLSYVVAPGYDKEARDIVVRCIKVMSVIPAVLCLTAIGLAILRQKKDFGITALKTLFISAVGIISVLIFGRGDVANADILSIAFVVGVVLYCVVVRLMARRYGRVKIKLPRPTEDVKVALRMMPPLFVSCGIARVALMVGKIIASVLGAGAVSAVTYAQSLYIIVGAIFVTNLTTIILTDFNNMCANREYDKITETMKKTIAIMTLILIPITLVSAFCAKDIIKIVYERGKFSAEDTAIVGGVLLFYAVNFIPVTVQGVQSQCLYAFGDSVKPMIISAIAIVINIASSLALAKTIGLPGVALGTCISTVVAVILQDLAVRKKLPNFGWLYSGRFIWKCLSAGIVSAAAIWAVTRFVSPALLRFVAAAAAGIAVFFAVMILLKEEYTITAIKELKAHVSKAERV